MSIEDYRTMAAKMNQHMAQLATEGIDDTTIIIDRMMGYVPELHQIWSSATDQQLRALSNEFPGFYRYAFIMEEAFEKERLKNSRPYDDMPEFCELHKKLMNEILTTGAALESEFFSILNTKNLSMSYAEMAELNTRYQRWLNDIEFFRKSFQSDATKTKMQVDYINKVIPRLARRIGEIVKRIIDKADRVRQRTAPLSSIPSKVATSLHQCRHCGKDIALLIFGDNASDLAGLEAYAEIMEEAIKRTNLPTYVLAASNDPDSVDNPSLLLKVHPAREEPFLITPNEWQSLIEKISDAHCKASNF